MNQLKKAKDVLPPAMGNGEVIVLVEDNDSILNMTMTHLTDCNYKVFAFSDAPTALRELSPDVVVDLLITDVIMPKIKGPELAARFRKETPDLPVIYISGHSFKSSAELGDQNANSFFLQKPFRLVDLENEIRASLMK